MCAFFFPSRRKGLWGDLSVLKTNGKIIGSLSIDDGNGSENVTSKMNSRFSKTVAFIPIR